MYRIGMSARHCLLRKHIYTIDTENSAITENLTELTSQDSKRRLVLEEETGTHFLYKLF